MSEGRPYIPVNCNFYDELEALATLSKPCELIFQTEGAKTSIKGIIKDLYVREGIEYLKMDSGLEIRLDALVQVDGKIPANYC
jgi:Rho-binding antiterminator